MNIFCHSYRFFFEDGGIAVFRGDRMLYANPAPLSLQLKTQAVSNEFCDGIYESVSALSDGVRCEGSLSTPGGSRFCFRDDYLLSGTDIRLRRRVAVEEAGTEKGFASLFSLVLCGAKSMEDIEGFAPGCYYLHNRFAPAQAIGSSPDMDFIWFMETHCALPLFGVRNPDSGESLVFSRWAPDITLRNLEQNLSENSTDPLLTIGGLGVSRRPGRTLNYTYYGYEVSHPAPAQKRGLSLDYVYPGSDGQFLYAGAYAGLDFHNRPMGFSRLYHPVTPGFAQEYSIAVSPEYHSSYYGFLRESWRSVYDRMRAPLFAVSAEQHFRDCMDIFLRYTERFADGSVGLPFAAQLPDMDINSVSFQFGFVGQQPAIGGLCLRYGLLEKREDFLRAGTDILDFWTRAADTESGLPPLCYNPSMSGFEPYPVYIRMLADGMEAILRAYRLLKEHGTVKEAWLRFCEKTGRRLVRLQNPDGSYFRAYYPDSSVRMSSRANTPAIIRFLIELFLETGEEALRDAALRAGEWTLTQAVPALEYRGGTCDNADVQDKEAGIYAMWGMMALHDLTGDAKWLDAAQKAADYTESWTYVWSFPVKTPWKKHPFNQYSISGQSIIYLGGGADCYMAACSLSYYRLYLSTGDRHYLDFARFLHKNTKQSTDVGGKTGYAMPALGHEASGFWTQTVNSHYHWLPWCTFVEAEPTAGLYDLFGVYEIDEAEAQSLPERQRRNRIYRTSVNERN
ncbi:hypothetical protein [Lachnoclostridium sp. Marseille-P6806]|uniref:hypothetical protein n=1 Tax=Lachnoclostridium sp. Marseille-P6806 TaxID=2364793 RepID=UPI0010308E68|nr:hypothetical protein [Lachnoclostridium sp. Marseille-P6806]